MKFFLVLLIFLMVGSTQRTPVKDAHLITATAFDAALNTYYILRNDTLISYETEHLEEVERKRLKYADPAIIRGKLLAKDSTLYFISQSGGMVHQMIGDTLVRVDSSYDHKMQINSSFLVHKDTILRYGGYGFWSNRNFFTYYDHRSREWELVSPSGSTDVPEGVMNALLLADGNTIYVLGGHRVNPIDPIIAEPYRQAWKFDLDKRAWFYLGELNFEFDAYRYLGKYEDNLILWKTSVFYLLNPKDNTFRPVIRNPSYRHFYKIAETYYHDGFFYILHFQNNALTLEKATFDQLFDSVGESRPAYYDGTEIWTPILVTMGSLLLIFVGYRLQKRLHTKNKIRVSLGEIRFRNQVLEFDLPSREILLALLRSPSGVNSNELLSIVENPEHNQAHNIKVKNQYVESINFKLRALLSIEEDLIRSYRSPADKRMKVYRIEKKYFTQK